MTRDFVQVRDLLRLPSLRNRVQVVAGQGGLGRRVRWVHVSELLDIPRLLNGGEFLLTTGMLLANVGAQQQKQYVRDLATHGAAGLAIELVQWMREVPGALIEACDQFNLPLIAIYEEVRFSAVTEEAARILLYRRQTALHEIEEATSAMMRQMLSGGDLDSVLHAAHHRLKRAIAVVLQDGQVRAAPEGFLRESLSALLIEANRQAIGSEVTNPVVALESELLAHVARVLEWTDGSANAKATTVPVKLVGAIVHVLGHREGTAWLCTGSDPRLEDRLMADRVAMCVGTALLHHRQRRSLLESLPDDPLDLLLAPNAEESVLRQQWPTLAKALDGWVTVAVVKVGPHLPRSPFPGGRARKRLAEPSQGSLAQEDSSFESCIRWLHQALQHQLSAIAKDASRRPVRLVAASLKVDSIRAICTGENYRALLEHLRAVLQDLKDQAELRCGPKIAVFIGIGRPRKRLAELHQSYQDAVTVCEHQASGRTGPADCSFEDLGLSRLLDTVERGLLETFARVELAPLLSLPRPKREVLLATLRALVDTNFNVAAASRRLHMRRPSVYRHLYQLDDLLGVRAESPDRRATIVLALRAWDLLQPARDPEQA